MATLDRAVDAWFEPVRGRRAFDVAAKAVSGLGDRGLVWTVSTLWVARQPGERRTRALRGLAAAGFTSMAVNAALKGVVGRPRPERAGLRLGGDRLPLREPATSSFPSGHTLAAFCAATVLSEPEQPAGTALRFGFATMVGLSRIHVRAHHASDVVGGVVIGCGLGVVLRSIVRRRPAGISPRSMRNGSPTGGVA